ncbi:hypothetical protein BD309DRAFT_178971 [Dichomitus squalens]|nr:hypothetical protein BD309DRAFT_178971 [Dichomitus squalens]
MMTSMRMTTRYDIGGWKEERKTECLLSPGTLMHIAQTSPLPSVVVAVATDFACVSSRYRYLRNFIVLSILSATQVLVAAAISAEWPIVVAGLEERMNAVYGRRFDLSNVRSGRLACLDQVVWNVPVDICCQCLLHKVDDGAYGAFSLSRSVVTVRVCVNTHEDWF